MKRCPDCAEEVQQDARICRFCGYEFEAGRSSAAAAQPQTRDDSHPIRGRLLLGLAFGSAAGMSIGAFGPWLTVGLPFVGSLSVSGTDQSNDGWIVVAAALLGVGFLYAAQVATVRTTRIFTGVLAVAAGVAAVATCFDDRSNVSDVPEVIEEAALISIGWGLNLALVASCVFTITACVSLLDRRKESPAWADPSG